MTIHRRKRAGRRRKDRDLLKDRLIQTRVPGGLENALKDEAKRRRLSVSHLIRNVLEDTFHLVDGVVSEVDNLVQDSVDLAMQVSRDAGKIAKSARSAAKSAAREPERARSAQREPERARSAQREPERARSAARESERARSTAREPERARSAAQEPERSRTMPREPGPSAAALESIYAWDEVVMNRAGACSDCACALEKGEQAYVGLGAPAGVGPVFLCGDCLAALSDD